MPREFETKVIIFATYATLVVTYPSIILTTLPVVLFLWSKWNRSSSDSSNLIKRIMQLGIFGVLVLFVVFYLISPYSDINLDGFVLLIPQLTITNTLFSRVYILIIAYSTMQASLFFIGFFLLFLSTRDSKPSLLITKSDDEFVFWIIMFYLVVFFAPLEFSNRVEMFIRPFIAICIIIGAETLVRGFDHSEFNLVRRRSITYKTKLRNRSFFFIVMLVLAAVGPTTIAMEYTLRVEPHNPTYDEYNAFNWLSKNVPEGGYVLTDPATGFLMRAFTLRNCSTSFLESGTFPYPLKHESLLNQLFLFFNASKEDDDAPYDKILNMRGSITFVVVSPRTSSWLYEARQGRISLYSPYEQIIPESDPAFSKFTDNGYELVMQFGSLKILVRNVVMNHFFEPFNNVSLWHTNVGNPPYSENGYYFGSNSSQQIEWTHIYTSSVSIADPSSSFLRIRYRTNVSGVACRVFSYSSDELQGHRIYSDWLQPRSNWIETEMAISDMAGFDGDPMESLSVGVTGESFIWTIFIDFIYIYEIQRFNSSEISVSQNATVSSIEGLHFNWQKFTPQSEDLILENRTVLDMIQYSIRQD